MIDATVVCELPGPDKCAVQNLINLIFNGEQIASAECLIVFTDDEYLNRLKKEFFDLDQLTDVIAFRLNDYSETAPEGEIYISLPRALENSKQYDEPFGREVARLIIHGCLHLLGYEDGTVAEKKQMRDSEENYLSQFDWHTLIHERNDI